MKNSLIIISILVLSALLLVGCGKSAQQKQMESDLNTRVMQMHDQEMAKMRQALDLEAQLDSAMTMHDSLGKQFPKQAAGHTGDDIAAAKEKLAAARGAMDNWMTSHKPYNEEMDHEQAMAQMNAEVESLTQVSAQLDSAIQDATRTIETHKQFATDLMAKTAKRRR